VPTKDPEAKQRHSRTYYLRNRDAVIAKSKEYNAETNRRVREYVASYLVTHPCVDCGEADPIVLEFDHRDPTSKEFTVFAGHGSRYSFKRVVAEINKCDVRCANCHRRKSSREAQTWRWKIFGDARQDDNIGA
jgi:hypothetical protein